MKAGNMKSFYDPWTAEEIKQYVEDYNVLVLFELPNTGTTAQLLIYGKMNKYQKHELMDKITHIFGGVPLSSAICTKVNEFAEKWYNKEILKRKARVINIKRKQ